MNNEIIYDEKGRPDIMVSFTPDELDLPAQLNDRPVKEYLISKYLNCVIDGVPYSMPFGKPCVDVSFDDAVKLCESKGEGWHLITNDEWAAIALKAWKEDTVPTGNTRAGRSHSHPEQRGTLLDGSYGVTLTGSGPVEWNHDRTPLGIADMVGNVLEHVGGVRFLDGQVQVIPDNRAAAGADQSTKSKDWKPILTSDGSPVYYYPIGDEVIVQNHSAERKIWGGAAFSDVTSEIEEIPEQLIRLGLYPPQDLETDNYFWLDNRGERCVARGGPWYYGADAGLFSLFGSDRSGSDGDLGFRSAYVRYSDDPSL